jgi:V-type H+-transporting ATPase subunit a
VDPAWYMSKSELVFINSLKMKTSVIFGVAQMAFGVCCKALNARYFKRYVEFWFEFLPQIVLLLALFGFMDFMIIYKWTTNWHLVKDPPSIIQLMIEMGINGGSPNKKGSTPMFEQGL